MTETLAELEARLNSRVETLQNTPPRRDGEEYVWDLPEGGAWRTRAYMDRTGRYLTPIAPAFYTDQFGNGHANIPELCRLVELEETPENQMLVARMLIEQARTTGLKVHLRDRIGRRE